MPLADDFVAAIFSRPRRRFTGIAFNSPVFNGGVRNVHLPFAVQRVSAVWVTGWCLAIAQLFLRYIADRRINVHAFFGAAVAVW